MSSWTNGYVADVGYTHGFYKELAPTFLNFCALLKGVDAKSADQIRNYCELGCGQGFTANILAAGNPNIMFYANDFNPTQIAGARRLADSAGLTNVKFYDQSFEQFRTERTLPEKFDIIVLHGIFSWISEDNRKEIVKFIDEKLEVGGILYASYNVMPGWAVFVPMRRLLIECTKDIDGSTSNKIEIGLEFLRNLSTTSPLYIEQNQSIKQRLEKLSELPRSYIAHEYFNKDWTPFYFTDAASQFSDARLEFIGSCNPTDQLDAINLTAPQQELLASVKNVARRETMRDFMVNQQFRKDLYGRGIISLNATEVAAKWQELNFVLSVGIKHISLIVKGALGDAKLHPEIYEPIIEILKAGPTSLQKIIDSPTASRIERNNLLEAMTVLVGNGTILPFISQSTAPQAIERCRHLNMRACELAVISGETSFLASPVTGSGLQVEQAFLLFVYSQLRGDSNVVQSAWKLMEQHGRRLIKDGAPLMSQEENITELTIRFTTYQEDILPVLKQHQIVTS